MQYAVLIYDEGSADPSTVNDDPAEWERTMGEYNAYTAMLRDKGAYRAGEALEPVTTATTIRIRDGETVMTDGPFAETKEVLGGYYLIDVDSLDAALEWAAKLPGAAYGTIEVRPVVTDYEPVA